MFRIQQTIKQHSRQLLASTHGIKNLNFTLNPQVSKNFSLFKQKGSSSAQQSQQDYVNNEDPLTQRRSEDDIVRSIDFYRQNIDQKTQPGLGLSKKIAETVQENKFQKMQRYEIFITKMTQLYKSEIRFRQKQSHKVNAQKNAALYSFTPLKEILRNYNDLTVRGFNSELTTKTLKNLSGALRARGFRPRVMNDYSITELDQSWRMQKLVDDIKFGLRPDQFYSPVHLAETSERLGELGYKNTELLPQFFDKINSLLEERLHGTKVEQKLEFEHAVYGSSKNFIPRHYVFKGFENSEEFNEYLGILLDYESNSQEFASESVTRSKRSEDEQVRELEVAMNQVINAAVQVKELQKDYQASIESIRSQYFLMQDAADKFGFLQEHPYIKYDLLELQELLVKGGYIEPEEALGQQSLVNEPFQAKMDRAAEVFYDYVLNYAPELLSPQHNAFYEAAMKSREHIKKNNVQKYMEENHNLIDLSTLSRTLVGLSNQALSFRRDTVRKEYLNKFYEELLMPLEHRNTSVDFENIQYETVMMERSYLKGWQIFTKESAKILPQLKELIKQDKNSIEGQLQALNALNACRFEESNTRNKVIKNALHILKQQGVHISQHALVGGLMGLAQSPSIDESGKTLGRLLAQKLIPGNSPFTEQIDALWSLCALELYDTKAIANIIEHLNTLSFERLDHDLKYDEYIKLLDVHTALKLEAPKNLQITNKSLLLGLNGKDMYLSSRFLENLTKYDPFKQRVIQGLAKGLTEASVSHQLIMENELFQEQTLDQDILNPEKYPYKPDVLMGYKGAKVGIFVLPETQVMRDTHKADGSMQFRMRLLQKASNNQIKTATVSVPKVIQYDIEGLKIELNKDFNFSQELETQIKLGGQQAVIDFSDLSEFGYKFVVDGQSFTESLPSTRDVQKMNAFAQKLYQIFHLKQQTELKFEPEQRQAGQDEIRFQLMKLSLMHDSLSKQCKDFLAQYIPQNHRSFESMLLKSADTIKQVPVLDHQVSESLDSSWLGTRSEVELPVTKDLNLKKSIVPEMINQRFMWVEDYFHYRDWQQKQKEVFDNFNLLVIPPHKDAPRYFFDQDHHHRRIPMGVFPQPNFKRILLQPSVNLFQLDQNTDRSRAVHDELVQFEKEPFKMMVVNEFKKAETLRDIDNETSMITNLQNVKQGLKANYSDQEILNTILLNLNFTEQLIEEHLKLKPSNETQGVKYLERDPSEFRKFVASTYHSKNREDPYTHFFLKEGVKKESLVQLVQEEKDRQIIEEESTIDLNVIEQGNQRRQKLQEKIDNVLLEQERINEDLFDLSSSLKQSVSIKYDMRSLVKSEFIYDVDPELADTEMTDQEYLDLQRRRAEQKLIKMKIIYKLHNSNTELTANEKTYLKKWTKDIKENKDRNLLNLRDSLLPTHATKLSVNNMESKSFYTLNSISKVHFDRDTHGQFSLSDLIVELSHFLDEDVVNKVETEMFSDRLRRDWGLSKDFKAVETRNKEISLVLNELEELVWRAAGQLETKDLNNIKRMLSIKRNKDEFDKQFYDNDMKSFEQFCNSVNQYDDRIKLIEKWIVRKEEEISSRVNLPPEQLKKTDQELYQQLDKPLRRAREKLVSRLLLSDEHGNPIEKTYKDLTSRELGTIVENLCIRLYLFNYEYPKFLPQIVKAIMEHPNLQTTEEQQLDTFCKMFELDWRGDKTQESLQEFMSSNPIHVEGDNINSYGDITSEKVQEKLRKACVPYVEETAEKLLNFNA